MKYENYLLNIYGINTNEFMSIEASSIEINKGNKKIFWKSIYNFSFKENPD